MAYQQPSAQPTNRSALWGVLGIVVGFFCCPVLGFGFGYLSLQDSKRNHTSPTLAYAAFGASAASILIHFVLLATGNDPYWRNV